MGVLRRGACGVELFFIQFNLQVNFLTPLIPKPNPIPTRWMEYNPIETKCTVTLTSQCRPRKGGHVGTRTHGRTDRQGDSNIPLPPKTFWGLYKFPKQSQQNYGRSSRHKIT